MSTLEQQQQAVETLRQALQAMKDLGFLTEGDEDE